MEQFITLFMVLFMQAEAVLYLVLHTVRASLRVSYRRAFWMYQPILIVLSVVYGFVPPMHWLTTVVVLLMVFISWGYICALCNEPRGKLMFVETLAIAHLLLCNTIWLLLCDVVELFSTYSHTAYYNILLLGIPLIASIPLFSGILKRLWRDAATLGTMPWFRLAMIPVTFIAIYVTVYILRAVGYSDSLAWHIIMVTITICFYTTASQLVFGLSKAAQAARTDENMRFVESQIGLQAARFAELAAHGKEIAALKHNLRQHAATTYTMLSEGKTDAALEYMAQYVAETREIESPHVSSNEVVDTIIRYYLASAAAHGIKMETEVELPRKIGVADTDLCVVLGNLLENAIDACRAMPEGAGRWMRLHARMKGDKLLVSQRNSFDGKLLRWDTEGEILSSKSGGGGLGLGSVENIAQKYGGMARFYPDGDVFVSEVWMNGEGMCNEDI